MVRGLLVLLICQLIGEFLVTALGVPVPGPVVGMVILLVALKVRRPAPKSPVVKTADSLLAHLQLLFIPAGVGVVAYLPLLGRSWLPIVGGLVIGWLAALVLTAAAGVATLRVDARVKRAAVRSGRTG
ncbi:MAG TPA: CidA/LrgA family protein [Propionibacteriaceae bacterium]|nr:CidA/LrgA family protein [Propionibacteriaceae bacterium]